MTGRPVSLGLIGCGTVVQYCHLPALQRLRREVRLIAAADVDRAALERVRRTARIETGDSAEALIARSDIEAVLIALPPEHHARIAAAAAMAGKHVYLEKPIATGRDDAQELVAAVAGAGVTVAVGFNRRLHPLYEQARGLLQRGAIGPVRNVQTTFCEPAPAAGLPAWKRVAGGVLLDLASHHIDLLRWFLGDEVDVVDAGCITGAHEQESASLRLVMRGGAEAQSYVSFRAGYADALEFQGERGTLRVDRHRARLSLRVPRSSGYGVRSAWVPPSGSVLRWWGRRVVRRSEDPSYYRALGAFAAQVRGAPARTASLDDGWRSLEVVLAAVASGRTGTSVRVGA